MTEDQEQQIVVEYLETIGALFSATAQSTYTKSWNQKAKNRRVGVRKGVPDLIVILPGYITINGKTITLFIEMKKSKGKRGGANGSVLSDEQAVWIWQLRESGIPAYVCYGAEDAIRQINKYITQRGTLF